MQASVKLSVALLFIVAGIRSQTAETDRLMTGELKMTFPGIYFKHNSADFAEMPYTVDSCFSYIAAHFEDNQNSLVVWRDSAESEELTAKRIRKLKAALGKYVKGGTIDIHSMGKEQKISQRTIQMALDNAQKEYLLSLNSVFDSSKTRFLPQKEKKKSRRRLVWTGWKHGFHWSTAK